MTFKLLKRSKFFFSLVLICNLAVAQKVSESINVGETNKSTNFSVQGVNPVTISLKAKAELPVALIENYLNQDKDVRVESESDISFSGSIHKTSQKSATLSFVSKNAGLISFVDGSKMYSTKGKLNINVTTEGSIVFSSLSFLQTNGGNIRLKAFKVSQNVSNPTNSISLQGTLDASSHKKGGMIVIESDHITVASQAKIMAKGALGGGAILIGGDWQGGASKKHRVFNNPKAVYQATTVNMLQGASIDASATQKGNGGTVVLWSDLSKSDGFTLAQGTIAAKGGANGGDGGWVESSGPSIDIDSLSVDTRSASPSAGKTGLWLIDPYDYTINASQASAIVSALASSNVEVTTTNNIAGYGSNNNIASAGGIWINSSIVSNSANSLTLKSHAGIVQAADVTVSTNGGSVTYWTDSDNNGTGSIYFFGAATFNTNGGNITLAGGADSGGSPAGYTLQIYAAGPFTANSNGGNILLRSRSSTNQWSTAFAATANFDAGSGSITMNAEQTGTAPALAFLTAVNMTSSKVSGTAIELSGTASSSIGVVFNAGAGVFSTVKSTGAGAITINGTSTNPSSGAIGGIYLFADVLSGSGAITLNGGAAGIVMSSSGASVLGQKAGQVDSSSSNISLVADRIDATAANTGLFFVSSGTASIMSSSASFSGAFDWTSKYTLANQLTGFTLGKVGNSQSITLSVPTSIAGPISLIGSNITLNQGLTATGTNTITLQGSGNVTEGANGFVNAANLRLSGGNVTLDSTNNDVTTLAATGVSNLTYVDSNALTVGVVTATGISATGAVSLTGTQVTLGANVTSTATTGAGVSINGTSIKHNSGITVSTSGANIAYNVTNSPFSSGDDIAIDLNRGGGAAATINAAGGNIDINASFASSGAAGTGNSDFAIGARNFSILTSGNGTININGDASNNTGTGSVRGFWLFQSKVISGAGAIDITGTGGKASSQSSGVFIDWASSILSASGAITLTDQKAAGLTGVHRGMLIAGSTTTNRTFLGANGVDVVTSSSSITLRSDALSPSTGNLTVDSNINSSGTFTLESVGSTFSSPITVGPTFSANIGSVTIGKPTNTANITLSTAINSTGSVALNGGNITLSGNITTTNTTTGNVTLNATTLNGSGNIALASGRALSVTQSGNSTYSGLLSGTNSTLTKLGGGTLTLSGASSYTGATTITSGGLVFSNNTRPSTTGFSGAGQLTIEPSASFDTDFNSNSYTYATTLTGLTFGKSGNTTNITFGNAITINGPISVPGAGLITIGANITSQATSGTGISFNGNRILQTNQAVSTSGADILYAVTGSPQDSNNNFGIDFTALSGSRGSITAAGGNISLSAAFAAAVGVGGDRAIRLQFTDISTTSSGTINILGDASNNTANAGVRGIQITNVTLQSVNGAINVTGTAGLNGASRGIEANTTSFRVLSQSGAITISDLMPAGSTAYNGMYLKPSAANAIIFGANATAGSTSSSSVTLRSDKIFFDTPNSVIKTTGAVVIESSGDSFQSDLTSGNLFSISPDLTPSSFRVGKTTNTSNITLLSPVTVAGPISLFGGALAINSALTATNNTINLTASGAVTQTAALTATNLSLNGTGTFTLNYTANTITTIAGGTNATKLGSVSFTDASGGLTIGTVGANSGLTATGTILAESLIGDVTLAQNLTTDNTTSNAVVVNAGKSSAIGTTTGGNILISGTPTITIGTGGIAKLYSGSEAASTGLTTLVGGLANTRFSADEGTTTFSPVLAAGNSYAIYRSTVPASPTGLVATAGNAQISIAFTAGADGGDAITNYEYTIDGGTTWIAANPAVTSSPLVITGLTNYTAYTVQIRAVNNAGAGTASASVSATPFAPATAPSDITLSASAVNENVAANTVVGTFSSTDVNVGDTFTYTLVAGSGDTDNAAFNISGTNLSITASPDFETKSSYNVRVRTTDQGGLFFEKAFTITVTNVNEAPTDIALSATSINENVAANSAVGTLSTSDIDASNTFTYTLVAGSGDTDNAAFNISGANLRITASPDFETKSSYNVRVRTTDQGGLNFEKAFTITVTNVNEAPTNIALSATSINENVAANSAVGTLSTSDVDTSNTFTYTLVAGSGDTDNAAFNISGTNLRITASPDFETKSSYNLRVRTTDQGGLFFEKAFTITVTNVNEAPTDLALSATSINENIAANSAVGTLSTSDVDASNTFTYTLVAGSGDTDNAAFNISGANLRITASPDFETKSSYNVRVRTTDQGGLNFEKAFTITVTDVFDTPTITVSSNTLNTFIKCAGSASLPQSFTVSGVNMSAGISVNALAGFEYSLASNGTYTTTLTVGTAGTIASTEVFVRMQSSANNATYASDNIALSSTGATTRNVLVGGTVTTIPTPTFLAPTVQSFTALGATTWTAPAGVASVEYLVVGGGGGGGNGWDSVAGGGGGAGMVLTGRLAVTPGTTYPISIGDGGVGGSNVRSTSNGTVGENTEFASIRAFGGGRGFSARSATINTGLAQNLTNDSAFGGSGGSSSNTGGSGGGGAVGNGNAGSGATAGTGGTGRSSSITGSALIYGAGGNGGTGNTSLTGANGLSNRGNGGNGGSAGGSSSAAGGKGGSGIVVLRYATQSTSITYCQGETALPLQATAAAGNTLQWYTVPTGGSASTTAPTPDTSTPGTTLYYVSQIDNTTGCESARAIITVTVNAIPVVPTTAATTINYCLGATPTALNASTLSGHLVYWFEGNNQLSSVAPVPLTTSVGTTIYSVSQRNMSTGCESPRTTITVNINAIPTISGVQNMTVGGSTLQLTGSGTPDSTTPWASSNLAVATVSSTGLVTAVGGGTTTITYRNTKGCSITAIINVVDCNQPFRNALAFGNGSTAANADFVQVNSRIFPSATVANFTIETWIRPAASDIVSGTTGNTWMAFLGYSGSSVRSPSLYITNNGVLHASWSEGPALFGTPVSASSPTSLVANKWTHVALVKDGTTARLFVDGIQIHSVNCAATINVPDNFYWLGKSDNQFNGALDEVRFWSTARTQAQIQASMNTELAGNETGLLAYFDFNQGVADGTNTGITTVTNKANNAINGSLNNFTGTGSTSNFVGNSTANIDITGASTICGNSTSQYTHQIPGGTWSVSNGAAASVSTSGLLTAVGTETITLSYAYTINGCSFTATRAITINAPAPPVATTTVNLCQGATANALSATALSGHTLQWYTVANGGTASPTAPTPNTTAVGTFTFWVSQRSTTSPNCESSRTAITVNVNAIPTISGVQNMIVGGATLQLTGSGTPSASTPWVSSNTAIATISTTGEVTAVAGGSTTITYSTLSGCSTTATINIIDCSQQFVFGNALNFDGVNDLVVLDNTGSNSNFTFSGTSRFTLEAWVNRSAATTGEAIIIAKHNGNVGNNYLLSINSSGFPVVYRESNAAFANNVLTGTNAIPLNEWRHLAVVYDGTNLQLYVNGVLNRTTTTGSITSNVSALRVSLGGSYLSGSPAYFFNGSIDDVRIWNIARTATQIQQNYLSQLQGNESGLVGYYNFNQGVSGGDNTSIASAINTVSSASNGTLTNFARTGASSNFVNSIIDITGAATICANSTAQYNHVITGGTWSVSNGALATVSASGLLTTSSAENITLTYTYTFNGCIKTATRAIAIVVPAITVQPSTAAQNLCLNGTATALTITANNLSTTYQWYRNITASNTGGTLISGATSASYTPPTTSAGTTYYYCVISGTCTPALTSNVSGAVTVSPISVAGTITGTSTICSGTTTTLTLAGNTGTIQWQQLIGSTWTDIAGTTNTVFSSPALTQNTSYRAVVTSGFCSSVNTANFNVVVNSSPLLTAQPSTASQNICFNGIPASLSVTATGSGLTYQWYRNTAASNTGGTLVSGATNAVFMPSNTLIGTTFYYCIVSGTCTPAITSDVSGAITVSPTSVAGTISGTSTICSGTTTTLTLAGNTGTIQWQQLMGSTWTDIAGANNAVFTSPTLTQNTSYRAVVTSGFCSSVNTASFNVVVNPIPVISGVTTVGVGNTITMTATTSAASSNAWVSSNTNVATINPNGVITGLSVGITIITYTNSNGCTDTETITVGIGTTLPPVLNSPVSNTTGATTLSFNYSLPETPLAGSVRLTFTPTAGGTPIVWTMNNATSAIFSYVVGTNPTSISNVLSGTALGFTTYNVTLTYQDAFGNPPASVTNTNVQTLALPNISFANTTYNGLINAAISIATINTGGGMVTYSITPTLPVGLSLNSSTGLISGSPTSTLEVTSFTVTATNAAGIDTATFNLFIDADTDGDGIWNSVDLDIDGDGVLNTVEIVDNTNANDPCDYLPTSQVLANVSVSWTQLDCDSDGIPNDDDADPDGDGVVDNGPDTDGDGINNANDTDIDGDGVINTVEIVDNTNVNNPCDYLPTSQVLANVSVSWSQLDCDSDGIPNSADNCPTIPNPSIITQPSSQTVNVCPNTTPPTLSVVATGQQLSYQWYINTTNSNLGGTAITGATSSSFVPSNSLVGARYYYVVVNSTCGMARSNASGAITFQDVISPTVLTQNVTVVLNSNGQATITAAQIDNGSTDNCGITSMTVSQTTFTCANIGLNTVTLTVTDSNNNISTGTAVVTVIDPIAPTVITRPVTLQLNAAGLATITATQVNNGSTDNCGITSMSVSQTTFTCANIGLNTVTLTVTDSNNNISTGTAVVTVIETIAPTVITRPVTVQLDATGNATVTAAQVNNGSTDNCGITSMTVSQSTFTCVNLGANTVTLTVTDVNGNSSSQTAVVTVQDAILPSVVTQNVTVNLDANGQATITAAQINNGSSDNCSIATITVSPSTFTCANLGPNTVTLTVTDVSGNVSTGTATVIVAIDFAITGDNDLDRIPDNCDDDDDNDGVLDVDDNCLLIANPDQLDTDGDGVGNMCDDDDDNDGVLDGYDNCPLTYNPDQGDRDNDGLGDACDTIEINVSEAITPNGDGINDTWIIYNIENHPNHVIRVYNRWGDEVMYAKNYQNNWDGQYVNKSNSLPSGGSYYYQIDLDGNGTVDHEGWIYITQ